MELRLLLSDKIPRAIPVISHFLFGKPKLGKTGHADLDPEQEFLSSKLLREDITMGVFEARSKSLGVDMIVKVKPFSSFRDEIKYSVYATSVGDFSALPHFVRVLYVIRDGPPTFLVRDLESMRALAKSKEEKAQLRRVEDFSKNIREVDYGYLVLEKLGKSITERYQPLIASKSPPDANRLFVYLFFQIVVILIAFEDFNIQHNDLSDNNILTWDVDKSYKEVVYFFPEDSSVQVSLSEKETEEHPQRFTIPLAEVDHALLKVIDFEEAFDFFEKCTDPEEVITRGLSALYDALGNPEEIKPLKTAIENCKFESLRDVLGADIFRKYLKR